MYAIANDVSFYLPLAETVASSWQSLHERFRASGTNRGAGEVEEARLIREGYEARIWLRVGDPGYPAYIERMLGYDPRTVRERLRVAFSLGELPQIEAALASGEVFYSAVRELTRVVVPETEAAWLAKARRQSLREVERMVSGRAKGDLPEAPSRPENIRHHLHFEVSASTFAKGRRTKRALEEELGHTLDDDAFLNLVFERALTPGESSTSRRAPHQIAITICDACKRGWQDAGGTPVEIDRASIEVAECDAERIGSLDAKVPVRASQDISPATRRLLLHRDQNRCQVSGCRASRYLHGHHIESRRNGGTGELENLISLCSEHHRAYHDGKLRQVTTEDGELRYEHVMMQPSVLETATRALVGLGFSKREADSFVAEAMPHVGREPNVQALVKEALRRTPLPGG